MVAPFVGAWIEIVDFGLCIPNGRVAPFVGAWIEMIAPPNAFINFSVAPFVGAWIEICREVDVEEKPKSLPSWERGLKYLYGTDGIGGVASLPSWERGLK